MLLLVVIFITAGVEPGDVAIASSTAVVLGSACRRVDKAVPSSVPDAGVWTTRETAVRWSVLLLLMVGTTLLSAAGAAAGDVSSKTCKPDTPARSLR